MLRRCRGAPPMLTLAALLVLLAGAAIGATAIGGVLAVPALTGVAGLPIGSAIAASSFGFLLTGLLGWRARTPAGAPPATAAAASPLWPLHLAALGGATAGVLLLPQVPAGWIRGWVALLTIGSGAQALIAGLRPARQRPARGWPRSVGLALIGAAVGCGSALSGTGGPVLLLPVLMLLGLPTLPAIAAAQAVQLPIALAATAMHLAAGRLQWPLAAGVGLLLVAGAWAGRRLARHADPLLLRRWTALALVASGLWYGLS